MSNAELLKRREKAVPRGPFHVAPIFAERAEGAKLWDVDGKEYIDFCGGIGVVNVGHNHPRVVAAIKQQADRLIHSCWHVAMYEPYLELCERLNALAPTGSDNMTALFNSGAEAGENAIKIARRATRRQGVIAFERGFHGRTLLGMTLTGKVKPYSAGFGPFAPEVYRLPYRPFFDPEPGSDIRAGAKAALDRLFAYHVEPENVACVIVEPVLGEGGFYPLHPEALDALYAAAREHGILFISDEVQTGFGRCGAMLACERYGIAPDMVATAKSLAGGMPLSAVTGRAEIMNAPEVGGIGGTFGGNPLACAAANAVFDVLRKENLLNRANEIGAATLETFRGLESEHAFVTKARGLGAMCAIEFVKDGAPDAERTKRIIDGARERGVLMMSASGNVLRTLMPLVISDKDLQTALTILQEVIAASD
jgi:4-aminobutyrate aminotransferase / (S)-3-amino-2-methylpropionate transaminase / 5-aminovalerate transaminase